MSSAPGGLSGAVIVGVGASPFGRTGRPMVVVVAGEYHVDGEPGSGGRRLGWLRISSERAVKIKLKRGLGFW